MKKCIPALVLILLLTGCFQYNISINLDVKDGADIKHHVYVSKTLVNMDNNDLKEEIDDDSVIITQNEDYIILSRVIHVSPEHFSDYGITINDRNGGYTAVFDPFRMMESEDREFNLTMDSGFIMDITLSNGTIAAHNGDSAVSKTVYFTIPYSVDEEYELPEIRVNTGSKDITLYIVVFAAIIIMLAGIVIIQLKGKK